MDKNLNSRQTVPWWLVLIQVSPLILQLVSEAVARYQGIPLINSSIQEVSITDTSIPDPLDVKLD